MPSTRLIVRGSPLPISFKGDLNKLWAAMLDRIEVISPFGEVQLQIGGLQPTSNKGPWLKDGQQFWVWDEATKTYVPLDITASLGPVQDAINAALVTARTQVTAEINTAVTAAIAGLPPPAVGGPGAHFAANSISDLTSGAITNGSSSVDIPFNHVETDTESGFSGGAYTIKKSGFYSITVTIHTAISSGSGSVLSQQGRLYKNGTEIDRSNPGVSVGGDAIFQINHQEMLTAGDKLTVGMSFTVTGGPVTFVVWGTDTRLSGFLTP